MTDESILRASPATAVNALNAAFTLFGLMQSAPARVFVDEIHF